MKFKFLIFIGAACASTALSTVSGVAENTSAGPAITGIFQDQTYLMTTDKMTLYTFDKDEAGVSNCYGECAERWPPLYGEAGAALPKNYSLVKRKDGNLQVAYKDQPLYLWVKDKKPGDMTGDGVKGVWHTAKP